MKLLFIPSNNITSFFLKPVTYFFQVIDGCAFRVYGHWVKKGEDQNRAALFENQPKTELKQRYVHNLSR